MDNATALERLNRCANQALKEAADARQALVKALGDPGGVLSRPLEQVLKAEGAAKAWRGLLAYIKELGVREGLAAQREECMVGLLHEPFLLNSHPVDNAVNLAELEGLRDFLKATARITVDEEPATPAPAPKPAPAAVKPPQVTPAQKRTLIAIRDTNVKLQEARVGATRVTSDSHETRPRVDMVELAITKGWACPDRTCSLFTGQLVTLTELGEAAIAG